MWTLICQQASVLDAHTEQLKNLQPTRLEWYDRNLDTLFQRADAERRAVFDLGMKVGEIKDKTNQELGNLDYRIRYARREHGHTHGRKMDNMSNTYTPSASKITMTPEAIKKLVNNIVSVVLEGTTIVYPRRETGIPGKNNQESFMEYRPTHFKTPERMTIPTINQGIIQGVIPNGNNQNRKLTEIGTINPICCNFTNTQDCYRKHLEDRINYHRLENSQ
ncbi:hypothetical protein CTI12_AA022860 [Artemisia annua]|uniref:Uncharacterized protein n=1 Tax=Artemisia annua TaxID=35608 RepID=A0A2U1Q2X9_ARTAN|nr:hypothetical protein CTI12_AA022860 [Artemisia annua]